MDKAIDVIGESLMNILMEIFQTKHFKLPNNGKLNNNTVENIRYIQKNNTKVKLCYEYEIGFF